MGFICSMCQNLKEKYVELYELLKSLLIGFVSIIAVMIMGKILGLLITFFNMQTEQNIKVISFIDTWASVIIFLFSTFAGIIGFAGQIYYKTKYKIKNSRLMDQGEYEKNRLNLQMELIPKGIENLNDHVAKIHLDAANNIGKFDPED